MTGFRTEIFPKTRIATNDVCAIGLQKHHIVALIEVDVSESRERINQHKTKNNKISFTAWLIKVISNTVKDFDIVAGFLDGKRKVIIFDDVNVSIVVEKNLNGHKIPIPLIIQKANERSLESISEQIHEAKEQKLSEKDIVLQRRSNRTERFYYILPGFIRRFFWQYLIQHPHFAFGKMGNVAVTSIGMIGRANGWFIPISIHPLCFGIGRITRKPIVVKDKIAIREILNITVLLDHDVVDGGSMARFISTLSANIEKATGLQKYTNMETNEG